MPSTDFAPNHQSHPSLGHVNLMVDSFIANASADELRAITRGLLATSPPSLGAQFKTIAQAHLKRTKADRILPSVTLFSRSGKAPAIATPQLDETLTRARTLYGAGMGFASLRLLTDVARQTIGLRWEDDGDLADVLAVIDSDLTQAIQSCKEEVSRIKGDFAEAHEIVRALRSCIADSVNDVQGWGGEFPFQKAQASLQCWNM